MTLLIWLVLFLAVVALLVLIAAYWRRTILDRYSGARPVTCPEDHQPAVVNIDVHHAVSTSMDGPPEFRLCDCSRWPERHACDQACLVQALKADPYKEVERNPARKPIRHIPVLLAAFAAWYVGMVWHSQYLFRARWLQDMGLTQADVKQMVWWLSPHLLTAAICLLFAYGVACLLALYHRKGVLNGVLISVLLCAALLATTWYQVVKMPHDLLLIEAGYAVLAVLIIGVIEGGLSGKVALRMR